MLVFTCLSIFMARIVDVTLGTIRTVLLVKGKKITAAIISFFEILIWFFVAREALNNEVSSILIPICYSLGFATGTLLGAYLSDRLIDGNISVQVVVKGENTDSLIKKIRDNGFGVSIIDLKDDYKGERKNMLFIELNKKKLKQLSDIILESNKDAFMIVNETKYVQNGYIK